MLAFLGWAQGRVYVLFALEVGNHSLHVLGVTGHVCARSRRGGDGGIDLMSTAR
jgi:hypothetical protein